MNTSPVLTKEVYDKMTCSNKKILKKYFQQLTVMNMLSFLGYDISFSKRKDKSKLPSYLRIEKVHIPNLSILFEKTDDFDGQCKVNGRADIELFRNKTMKLFLKIIEIIGFEMSCKKVGEKKNQRKHQFPILQSLTFKQKTLDESDIIEFGIFVHENIIKQASSPRLIDIDSETVDKVFQNQISLLSNNLSIISFISTVRKHFEEWKQNETFNNYIVSLSQQVEYHCKFQQEELCSLPGSDVQEEVQSQIGQPEQIPFINYDPYANFFVGMLNEYPVFTIPPIVLQQQLNQHEISETSPNDNQLMNQINQQMNHNN